MAAKNTTMTLRCDTSPARDAIAALKEAISISELNVSREALERLLGSFEFFNKLFAVDSDAGAAPAGEVLVRLEPTDFFTGFLAAVRAGDINGYVI